jgi:hypothetical protein
VGRNGDAVTYAYEGRLLAREVRNKRRPPACSQDVPASERAVEAVRIARGEDEAGHVPQLRAAPEDLSRKDAGETQNFEQPTLQDLVQSSAEYLSFTGQGAQGRVPEGPAGG